MAATGVPPLVGVRVKLAAVSVLGSMSRENVAVGLTVAGTAVAPPAGVLCVTVGGGSGAEGTSSIAAISGSSAEP